MYTLLYRPYHKVACSKPSDEEEKKIKFETLRTLAMSPHLRKSFEIAAILHHRLHLLEDEDIVRMYSSRPLPVNIYVQYEPAHVKNFLRLLNSASEETPGLPGDTTPMAAIPQILPSGHPVATELDVIRNEFYHQTYKAAVDSGLVKTPGIPSVHGLVVVLAFEHRLKMPGSRFDETYMQRSMACITITKEVLDLTRNRHANTIPASPLPFGSLSTKEMTLTLDNHFE